MSLFKRFSVGKIQPRLHDLLWPRDMKLRLFIWTCVGIVSLIIAFFASEGVALFLYDYTFAIAVGTSFGKPITLLFWLLFFYLIAYLSVRRKWRLPRSRRLFIIFLILVVLLLSINLLVFRAIHAKAGSNELEGFENERPVVVGFRPEATISLSSSTLESTHSLKPVFFWLFDLFTDADGMGYDMGAPLYPLFPAPGLVCPTVIALLLAYLAACVMIIAHTVNVEKKPYIAWFNCLVFSLLSFLFFEAALDGGPFTTYTQTGVALLSLYLLMRFVSRRRGKGWILALIFLPLLVLAALNLAFYNMAPRVIPYHQHFLVSSLCLIAAGIYEFGRRGAKSLLMATILFLLAFNLSSVRPYSILSESGERSDAYMIFSVNPSMTDNEVLERIVSAPDLVSPEIIARDARTLVAKATVWRAGVSSLDLAHQITEERLTPLGANIRFRFGNPTSESTMSIYLPLEPVELRQFLPVNELIWVNEIEEFSSDLTKVDFSFPQGLHGSHYVMLILSQHGMHLTHYIHMRPFVERSTIIEIRDFLRTLVPVTRLQPAVEELFP